MGAVGLPVYNYYCCYYYVRLMQFVSVLAFLIMLVEPVKMLHIRRIYMRIYRACE